MSLDVDLYYSVKLRRNLADSSISVPPGAAHYSYSAVANKFVNAFRMIGLIPLEIDRPEIYVKPPINPERRAMHIMFKPYPEFRILKRAYNIAHVAWEFEDLPRRDQWPIGDFRRRDPFSDYLHMLGIPDRIWVGCSFSKSVFEQLGVQKVDLVPAPITVPKIVTDNLSTTRNTMAQVSRLQLAQVKCIRLSESVMRNPEPAVLREHSAPVSSLIRKERTLFLLVANPGDLRKNLPALIDGFSLIAHSNPNILLIIKLTIDNEQVTLPEVLRGGIPRLYQNEEMALGDISPANIFLVNDFLTAAQLEALYCCCTFYLSAAVAEGQNLPLQEAMAVGVIPVTGNHTAMRDYVNEDNGVLIDWSTRPATFAFEEAYGMRNFQLPHLSAAAVADSVERACSLSAKDRSEKQYLSAQIIRDKYSDSVISKLAYELIQTYE